MGILASIFSRHVLLKTIPGKCTYRKRMENIRNNKKQPKIRFPWQHFKIPNAQLQVKNWGLQGKIYPTFCWVVSCQCFVGSQCEFADQTGKNGEDIDMFVEEHWWLAKRRCRNYRLVGLHTLRRIRPCFRIIHHQVFSILLFGEEPFWSELTYIPRLWNLILEFRKNKGPHQGLNFVADMLFAKLMSRPENLHGTQKWIRFGRCMVDVSLFPRGIFRLVY